MKEFKFTILLFITGLILTSCGSDTASIRNTTQTNDSTINNSQEITYSSDDKLSNWNSIKSQTNCFRNGIRLNDRTFILPNQNGTGPLTSANLPQANTISKAYIGGQPTSGDLMLVTNVQTNNGVTTFVTYSMCTYGNLITQSTRLENWVILNLSKGEPHNTSCPFSKINNSDLKFTTYGTQATSYIFGPNGQDTWTKFVPIKGCQ